MTDYSLIDRPSILRYIFYPRKDVTPCPDNAFDLFIAVDETASISCRFHMGKPEWPSILFFHGNGEVVSDYDHIAPFYHQRRINLIVADYRGYGASTGVPTLGDLVRDGHILFKKIREELSGRGLRNDLWVMGRSLGSISALELAYHYPDRIRGIIIESGFPCIVRIFTHLGLPTQGMDLRKIDEACLENIRSIRTPSLIIHGEWDSLVPLKDAKDLYQHLGSEKKELLVIPLADHNNIMLVGFKDYFEAIQRFVEKTGPKGP